MENQLLSGYCCMVKIQVPVAFHLGRKKKKKKQPLGSAMEKRGRQALLPRAARPDPSAGDSWPEAARSSR